jgi:hypothetical protein
MKRPIVYFMGDNTQVVLLEEYDASRRQLEEAVSLMHDLLGVLAFDERFAHAEQLQQEAAISAFIERTQL